MTDFNFITRISRRSIAALIPHFLILICFTTSIHAQDTSAVALLNRAYAALASNVSEAESLFERALTLDPGNLLAHRQLGYLYAARQQNAQALDEFTIAERLHSSDTIKLQTTYLLVALHREGDAKAVLQELQDSSAPDVRQLALEELKTLSNNQSSSGAWARIYAEPYYDTRWNSNFLHADLQSGYAFTDDQSISAYGALSLSTDTRSTTGAVPVIISDNTLLVGVGLLYKPFTGFSFSLQQGAAIGVLHSAIVGEMRNDFRAVAVYGNGIYPANTAHDDVQMPWLPLLDVYSSFGYYSRFHNGIGYAQVRAGARMLEIGRTTVDLYARADLAKDSEEEFYNNIIEGGVGIRVTPHIDWGLHLQVDYHRGLYWNVSDNARIQREALYDQYYSSVRIFLIFERSF